jgi:hypothetical protein
LEKEILPVDGKREHTADAIQEEEDRKESFAVAESEMPLLPRLLEQVVCFHLKIQIYLTFEVVDRAARHEPQQKTWGTALEARNQLAVGALYWVLPFEHHAWVFSVLAMALYSETTCLNRERQGEKETMCRIEAIAIN